MLTILELGDIDTCTQQSLSDVVGNLFDAVSDGPSH